ncbi:Tetraspanin [Trichostrongylus colubriformis]|uniref:Tetraspanin n=1 Tax=Trichostrongylus colubriformis TaxID=6319 RepID=A0AAN8IM88_TRICO
MTLDSQDQIFLGVTFATAVVGAALLIVGFVLRFGRGFGTFVSYAQADDDFLELRSLDLIFGLFTAAACVLILMFFVAAMATFKKNKFLLKAYCAIIALMVIVQLVAGLLAFTYSDQINQRASDDNLYESLHKAAKNYASPPPSDDETQFWIHTQKTFSCCGVLSSADWSFTETQLQAYSCFRPNYANGCEKQIRSRISTDSQYLGAASMGVVLVEIIASFLAGYRAYNLA